MLESLMNDYILLQIFPALSNPEFLNKLGAIAMIIVGLLVEKHFISRPSLFANVIALNTYLIARGITEPLLCLYANVGLILGIIAILAYWSDTSLSGFFYAVAFMYNSAFVGVIILMF
ncbi:hypothetical protein APY94_03390 [Thermococcus celericrescens]|uniref:Uncharacterized protein n=1 Tax=Thermococcus celericrescens TaxID=227598 RepID=A0A100XYY8_9EURY|nr:hypothetical protein [Thermococcus celericrescens]KUH34119.1 hypothetical protein APY94_03390 [Thermococcus celericrescens]